MAAIAQTSATSVEEPVNITRTVLSASDTLTYNQSTGQTLFLFNTTASPVTVTLTGSGATTMRPKGYGGTVSLTGGKAVIVPASGSTMVDLDDISAYLVGNITVTGGVGVTAHLFV